MSEESTFTGDDTAETTYWNRRVNAIENDLIDIKESLEFIKETMVKADTTIATIAGEVKPTLEALMSNPMLKMFLNKGKDK